VVLAGVGGDAAEREVDSSGVGRLVAWRLDGLEKGKGGSMVALAGVIARVRLQDVLAEVARWAHTVSLEKMNRWRLMFFLTTPAVCLVGSLIFVIISLYNTLLEKRPFITQG
jgi:hypothetical protein